MWEWTQTLAAHDASVAVRWGFTQAPGGVSAGPYEGLNLAGHVGDDPAAVLANRRLLAAELGLAPDRVIFMNQVHGARVVTVQGPADDTAGPQSAGVADADGMVTNERGLALVVLVADCVPVLLADPSAGIIGVAHAGRPGLIAGVVPAAVAVMREAGATDLRAVVGPSVCGRCYEVPAPMRAHGASVAPVSAAVSWTGTPALDVAAGVVAQLTDAGVALAHWVPGCTRESSQLYSYRRASVTGRFAGVIHMGAP